MSIKYFFNLWRSRVEMFKRYDQWCSLHSEETIPSDSVEWCWDCKYSDCNAHDHY